MTPILLSGPSAEPISLAEAKAWLKLDTSEEDDLIGALVTSARLIVESLTRRMLMNQSWRFVLDAWPMGLVHELSFAPLQSVSAIRVYDAAGVSQTVSASLYRVDASFDRTRIVFAASPSTPGRATAGIEIDIIVGYGPLADDVPAPLRQAIRLLVARWFEERGDALSDNIEASLPSPVAALIAAYRRMRLA